MDRTLIDRAKDGDHQAFTALAAGSVDRLYAVARLILRDADRADDAVQDALIAAWRGIHALRDPDAWTPWLQRLLVRACYHLARRERRSPVLELRLVSDLASPGRDDIAGVADRDLLERGFRRLTVEQRTILVLHFFVGLSIADLGDVLGIPEATVRSRLHRAKSAMRAALEADARAMVVAQEPL
jgi:RNA polymerase sigma-70 factor (ECF subfamily)